MILAKHETQTETGSSFISKQFEQRFSLPSGVKPDAIGKIYRTHTNSAPGYYFHARHLGGLVIEFSARDLLLEKVFYFDGKKLWLGVLYYL